MEEKLFFRNKYNDNHAMAIVSIVLGALLIASGVLGAIGTLDGFGFYRFYHFAYIIPEMLSFICWAVMGIFIIRFGCKPWEADFRSFSTVAIVFALSMVLSVISTLFIFAFYGLWWALVRRVIVLLAAAVFAALTAVNINRVEDSVKNALICWLVACICFWLAEWAFSSVFLVAVIFLSLAIPIVCFTDIGKSNEDIFADDFEMEFEITDEPFDGPFDGSRKKVINLPNPAFDDVVAKLKTLKELYEQEMISAEEYEAKRKQLVEKL